MKDRTNTIDPRGGFHSGFSAFISGKIKEYFGSEVFSRYFADNIYDAQEKTFVLIAPNHKIARLLRQKYQEEISNFCAKLWPNKNLTVTITVNASRHEGNITGGEASNNVIYSDFGSENYTFENFIISSSNKVAVSVLQDIAQNTHPNSNDNLIYLYGEVGYGKTHLARATIRECYKKYDSCYYFPADVFLQDFVNSIKKNSSLEFKQHLGNANLIIIDDLHMLIKKRATMEMLATIVCAILDYGRKVILTSTVDPSEISCFGSRLQSRIASGTIAKIEAPDINLKSQIINNLILSKKITMEPDAHDFLLYNSIGGIREIKGAINRLAVAANVHKISITTETIKSIVPDMLSAIENSSPKPQTNAAVAISAIIPIIHKAEEVNIEKAEKKTIHTTNSITVKDIKTASAIFYKITPDELNSTRRLNNASNARKMAIYIVKNLLNLSHEAIGEHFNKTKNTIVQICHQVKNALSADAALESDLHAIKKLIIMQSLSSKKNTFLIKK